MSPADLARTNTESSHQKALFAWVAMATRHGTAAADDPLSYVRTAGLAPDGGVVSYAQATYGTSSAIPVLKWLYAVPNGGKRDAVTAARMKAEGVRPGVWDIHLPIPSPRGTYRDLWIEMKRPSHEGKRAGQLSPDQAEFGALQRSFNSQCAVCWTWTEAVEALKHYIAA